MSLEAEKLFSLFEDLARKLEIQLVQGRGDFLGGSCSLRDQRYIVLNAARPLQQRLGVLARAFGTLDLEDVFIVPALRSYIEETVNSPLGGVEPGESRGDEIQTETEKNLE